jgi:hypothetical protein
MKKFLIYALIASFVVPFNLFPTSYARAASTCAGQAYCFTVQRNVSRGIDFINIYSKNGNTYDKVTFKKIASPVGVLVKPNMFFYSLSGGASSLKLASGVKVGIYTDDLHTREPDQQNAEMRFLGIVQYKNDANPVIVKGIISGTAAPEGTPSFESGAKADSIAKTLNTLTGKTGGLTMRMTPEATSLPDLPDPDKAGSWGVADSTWTWSFDDSAEAYVLVHNIKNRSVTDQKIYQYQFVFQQNVDTSYAFISGDGKKRSTSPNYLMTISSITKFDANKKGEAVTLGGELRNLAVIVNRSSSVNLNVSIPPTGQNVDSPAFAFAKTLSVWPFFNFDKTIIAPLTESTITQKCTSGGGYMLGADTIGLTNSLSWLIFGLDNSSQSTNQQAGGVCVYRTVNKKTSLAGSNDLAAYVDKEGYRMDVKEVTLPKAAVDKCASFVPKPDSFDTYLTNFKAVTEDTMTKGGVTAEDAKKKVDDMFTKYSSDIGKYIRVNTQSFMEGQYAGNWTKTDPPTGARYPNEHLTTQKGAETKTLIELAKTLTFSTAGTEGDISVDIFGAKFTYNPISILDGESFTRFVDWAGQKSVEFGKAYPAAAITMMVLAGFFAKDMAIGALKGAGNLVVSPVLYATGGLAAAGLSVLAASVLVAVGFASAGIIESRKQQFFTAVAAGYGTVLTAKHVAFQGCILQDTGASKPSAAVLASTGFTKANFAKEQGLLKAMYRDVAGALADSAADLAGYQGTNERDGNNCPKNISAEGVFEWALCNLYSFLMFQIINPLSKLLFSWLVNVVDVKAALALQRNLLLPKQELYFLPKTP